MGKNSNKWVLRNVVDIVDKAISNFNKECMNSLGSDKYLVFDRLFSDTSSVLNNLTNPYRLHLVTAIQLRTKLFSN